MQILKTFFGRRADGVWEVQNMGPVSLDPVAGAEDETFYCVKDGLFALQPNILGTIRFVLGQSIVPIVAHVPGEKALRCLGTGFFISCTGLLITAAHVVTEVSKMNMAVQRRLMIGPGNSAK